MLPEDTSDQMHHFTPHSYTGSNHYLKMADTICSSVTSSKVFLYSSGNEDEYVCERCCERETQLMEATDELSSAQMIINILQNELLLSKASTTTFAVNLFPTEGPCSKPNTEEWNLAAHNNNNVKSQKQAKSSRGEFASSGHCVSTADRFSPLSNLQSSECASTPRVHKIRNHQPKDNKIPTIVNGILDFHSEFPKSTYKQEETTNVKCHQTKIRKSQFVKCLNKAKYKVLIIGDSHTRNCAKLLLDNLSRDFKVSSFV